MFSVILIHLILGLHLPVSLLKSSLIASLIAQLVKNLPAMQETLVRFLGWEDFLEKVKTTHSSILGLPLGSADKESTCNAGDLCSIPGLGRFPGEGKSYPLQYSGLENSMDSVVHGVAKSWTQLNEFHFHFLLKSDIFFFLILVKLIFIVVQLFYNAVCSTVQQNESVICIHISLL